MIFQYTAAWVMGVSPYTQKPKIQTTRLDKPKHQPPYYAGQTVAVQPGYGTKGIGYIKLLDIVLQDIRTFKLAQVEAEGVSCQFDWARLWTAINAPRYCWEGDVPHMTPVLNVAYIWHEDHLRWMHHLVKLPSDKFQGRVYTFMRLDNKRA